MANHTSDDEARHIMEEIDVITDNLLAYGINAKVIYDDKIYQLIRDREQAAYKRGYIQCGLDSQEKAE